MELKKDCLFSLSLDRILPFMCAKDSLDDAPFQKKTPPAADIAALFDATAEVFFGVPLTLRFKCGEAVFELTGACDALTRQNGEYYISECCVLEAQSDFCGKIRDTVLGRGMLLALALANAKNLGRVFLHTWVFAGGEVLRQSAAYSRAELSAFLSEQKEILLAVAPLFEKKPCAVVFPFDRLREGQKKLIHESWAAIKGGVRLFACAPTGTGKTLAVMYPALKALETGRAEKVFYASPKNTLKMQAARAVSALQKTPVLRTVVLAAKMSICPLGLEECESAGCEYADSFYQKLPAALGALKEFSTVTAKELTEVARKEKICPFELCLQFMRFCDVIIGDYNHVFDPKSRLSELGSKKNILLIDEAHNLPSRIRENFTEALSPTDFDPFFSDDTPVSSLLRENFSDLLALFARYRKEDSEIKKGYSFQKPDKLLEEAQKLLPKVGFALCDGFGVPNENTRRLLRSFFIKLKKILFLGKQFDHDFAVILLPDGGRKITLVTPRARIIAALNKWKSTLLFSATLLPREYYFETLGGGEDDGFLVLPSPFPPENLFVGVCDVDVSFRQRFATAPKLCSIIRAATKVKKGNYLVFLPSFEYLELVSQEYKKRYCDDFVLVQGRRMSYSERKDFLGAFCQNPVKTLIGFCVMGGIFSEGIDLAGNTLSGEIIVGTGFPPPSAEAEAESQTYYNREMDGKSFAYTLPGFNRVLQAAGRVIRSETDRGFLILCDLRFMAEDLRTLFPESWDQPRLLERDGDITRQLEDFWK